jgi:hypothetical protein
METGVGSICKPCWLSSQAAVRYWDVPINIPSFASPRPKAKPAPGAKETDVWHHCAQHIGPSPASSMRVHVADRGADIFEFLHVCRSIQTHFVVRATQDRRVQTQEGTPGSLFAQIRSQPRQDQRPLDLPARPGHKARSTMLYLSWTHLELLPPRHDPRLNKLPPLPVWVIRVWEEGAPEGEEPIEWILLTSVLTPTFEQAWQRVDWYRARWRVEDDHQCLKSGCRIEERQLQTVDGLIRLLGLLSPLAVRLVQIREYARSEPERPAHEVIEPLMLAVLAQRSGHAPATMTVGTDLGRRSRAWVAIWHASMMVLPVGEPSGKAGSRCKPCLRALIWLFTSVC